MIRQATWFLTSPIRLALMGLIGLYRVTLGRLMVGRCRFHPSCSAYALEAIREHGALKGSALAAWRVARCSPLTAGGLDPVPHRGNWRSRSVV
ncbi:MAG: membrane protein insertion efficiency factor YidD [Actinomycetota bacterium]